MSSVSTIGYTTRTFHEDPVHVSRGIREESERKNWNIPKREPKVHIKPFQLVEIFNLPGRSSVTVDTPILGVTFNLLDVRDDKTATAVLLDGTQDIELLSNLEDYQGELRYRAVIGKIPQTLVEAFRDMVKDMES